MTALSVQSYRVLDGASGVLLLGMAVFSPWAYGSTQPWGVWMMNLGGYALGAALVMKHGIRSLTGYAAPRWSAKGVDSVIRPSSRFSRKAALLGVCATRGAAALTLVILGWALVSAVNARATFDDPSLTFLYRDCIQCLPHSLDAQGTWFAFWTYLGLASTFWAARDWLLGKSESEVRFTGASGVSCVKAPPARLNRLLCVLFVNGAVLGVESIAQRCANSSELLFLKKPRIHQTAEGQFGPYAYRSNAAQYFNLLWPVCLGWWYAGQRAPGLSAGDLGDGARKHWLLGAAALIAACPIVSSSRTGAITCAAMAVTCMGWPLVATRGRRRATNQRASLRQREMRRLAWGIAWGVGLGLTLGWHQLAPRLAWEQLKNGLAGRAAMAQVAGQMARDYPWLGTGPGTFETVSQLYARPEMFWPAQLHNDWLETRVTWGWLGSGLLWAGLGCVLARWFGGRDGIQVPGVFVGFIWLALGGCLAQARFDFPLQVHSVLFLFVLWCAVLGVARRAI